ncbi:hypothetical protein [Piscinibacter koreensis]|uniref:Uncharacterized protein n=1 Tax=Piscinibacter koreensis TaxID=2742824 RepID=A0A7Y6NNS6_9BURK|nr:hypothetical protein [Schlegelella koreensis]NUZ06472.1 hypothetical protein [Schlegelella koreensis]
MRFRTLTATPGPRHRRRMVAVAWLVFALVAAQSLGLLHRVVHAGSLVRLGTSAAVEHVRSPAAEVREPGFPALFLRHDGKSACSLFDGMTGTALAVAALLPLPLLVVPRERLRPFAADFVARWAALFDARGPPDFR